MQSLLYAWLVKHKLVHGSLRFDFRGMGGWDSARLSPSLPSLLPQFSLPLSLSLSSLYPLSISFSSLSGSPSLTPFPLSLYLVLPLICSPPLSHFPVFPHFFCFPPSLSRSLSPSLPLPLLLLQSTTDVDGAPKLFSILS